MSGALPASSLEQVAVPSETEQSHGSQPVRSASRKDLPEPATDRCGWTPGDRVFLWLSLVVAAGLLGTQFVRDAQRRSEAVVVQTGGALTPADKQSAVAVLSAAPSARDQVALFRIDVNTADWQAWMQLQGIGETLARRIVADRNEHGPFRSIDDVARVRGIGPKTLERLRPFLVIGLAAQRPQSAETREPVVE